MKNLNILKNYSRDDLFNLLQGFVWGRFFFIFDILIPDLLAELVTHNTS